MNSPWYSHRYSRTYLPLGFQLVNGGVFDSEKLDEEEELIIDSDKSDWFPLMYTALSPTFPIEPLVTGHKTTLLSYCTGSGHRTCMN